MTEGFVNYWEQVITQPDSPEYAFGQKMVGMPKVVFSKTATSVAGKNVRVENGPIVDAVNQLRALRGKTSSSTVGQRSFHRSSRTS
jgi:hypothetical protein